MNGINIFNHSVRQITGNLGMAIRVSWWFVAFVILAVVALYLLAPDDLLLALNKSPEYIAENLSMSGSGVLLLSLAVIAAVVVSLWSISLIAIVWHRYILLEENPVGTIPYNKDFRVGRYFWYGVGISLLAGIVAMVVGGFLIMIFGPSAMQSTSGAGALLGLLGVLIVGLIVTVLYLRMALILPAVALEEGLSLGKAWEASKGYTSAIAGAAVMLTILNMVAGFVLGFLPDIGIPGLLVSALELAYNWFYFMLNISILSTLYGHIVQKREVY